MAWRDHRIIWKKFRFKYPQCAGTALPERKQIRQVRGRAAMSQNGVSHSCDLLQICQALFAGLVLHDQIRSEHANHRDHVCNPRRCQHLKEMCNNNGSARGTICSERVRVEELPNTMSCQQQGGYKKLLLGGSDSDIYHLTRFLHETFNLKSRNNREKHDITALQIYLLTSVHNITALQIYLLTSETKTSLNKFH